MDSTEPHVLTFFYGSYMNAAVLREVGLTPDRIDRAWLPGFDIEIRPRANLVPSDQHTVFGVVVPCTHAELDRLYAHAEDVLGEVYRPHPVLTYTGPNRVEPALCYLSPGLSGGPAAVDYVMRIVEPARALGFPKAYIERVESFLPRP